MGRGGDETVDPHSLLYGGPNSWPRLTGLRSGSLWFREEIETLRSSHGPALSCRRADGTMVEGWLLLVDGDRTIMQTVETTVDGDSDEKRFTFPEPCRRLLHLEEGPGGLVLVWEARDGTCRASNVHGKESSVFAHEIPRGEILEDHKTKSAFLFSNGQLCSALIYEKDQVGHCLETRQAGMPIHRISVDPGARLFQGKGNDRRLVMAQGQTVSGNLLRIVDMATGKLLASIPCEDTVDQAIPFRNGDEIVACYTDKQGRLILAGNVRGEIMRVSDANSRALFKGGLPPVALDHAGRIFVAWPKLDAEGRTRIYGAVATEPAGVDFRRSLIEICDPDVEVESLTLVPGSGDVVWTEYGKGGEQAEMRVSPIEEARQVASSIGRHRPGQRVWIDSVRDRVGGGEILWRRAERGSTDSELFHSTV